jgi:kinetochore protein NDC80
MSRRQTLGVLSPGALNARSGSAAAPSRVAASKEGGGAGRKSMAPSAMPGGGPAGAGERSGIQGAASDPRRSSAYLSSKPAGPKQDPRPLGDKNFLNNCIRTVITYLSAHGFPAAVSPKTLASPTGKDFALIMLFLFQRFDPSLKAFGKVEDDVTVFLKRLSYPFQISKSALFAVGSPHSWPAVLAAITWLVELLNYNERAEEAMGGGASGGAMAGAGPGSMQVRTGQPARAGGGALSRPRLPQQQPVLALAG